MGGAKGGGFGWPSRATFFTRPMQMGSVAGSEMTTEGLALRSLASLGGMVEVTLEPICFLRLSMDGTGGVGLRGPRKHPGLGNGSMGACSGGKLGDRLHGVGTGMDGGGFFGMAGGGGGGGGPFEGAGGEFRWG